MPDYRAVDASGKPRYDVQPYTKSTLKKKKLGKVAPVQRALMRGSR